MTRAFPSASEYEKEWCISLVRANARIHAVALLHGESVIWCDPRLSAIGRHLMEVGRMVKKIREEGIECDL